MTAPPIISLPELNRALEANQVAEFWNALTDEWFTGELIPGSRRVPVDQVGREVAATNLPKDTAVVTYCSGPGCSQSLDAGKKLVALGFTNVRVFEGGLAEWKAANRPVVMEAGSATAK